MDHTANRSGAVIVVGSANEDLVLSVPSFPGEGSTMLAGPVEVGSGGKGANQAVAAARSGAKVSFVGVVGSEPRGERVLQNLRSEGVDVTRTQSVDASSTGLAVVLVTGNGANSIVVSPGANADLTRCIVEAGLDDVLPDDIVVVQCEIPTEAVESAIAAAARQGARSVLNLAPFVNLSSSTLEAVSTLVVNEGEALQLLGGAAPDGQTLAAAIATRFRCPTIVTLGSRGSVYADPDGVQLVVPAREVSSVVDTTGAGDVYVGVLAARMAAGWDTASAMVTATDAAAAAVTGRGAQAFVERPLHTA